MLTHVGVHLDPVGSVHDGLLEEELQQLETDVPAASSRVALAHDVGPDDVQVGHAENAPRDEARGGAHFLLLLHRHHTELERRHAIDTTSSCAIDHVWHSLHVPRGAVQPLLSRLPGGEAAPRLQRVHGLADDPRVGLQGGLDAFQLTLRAAQTSDGVVRERLARVHSSPCDVVVDVQGGLVS